MFKVANLGFRGSGNSIMVVFSTCAFCKYKKTRVRAIDIRGNIINMMILRKIQPILMVKVSNIGFLRTEKPILTLVFTCERDKLKKTRVRAINIRGNIINIMIFSKIQPILMVEVSNIGFLRTEKPILTLIFMCERHKLKKTRVHQQIR